MKKLLSCTLISLILIVVAGIYFHRTRTVCGFVSKDGTKVIEACECIGLNLKMDPGPGDLDITKIIGGKYLYCYGFTKLQACKIAPDFTLTDLQKFVCKDLLK